MDKYNELLESITTEELNEMLQDCISYDGSFDDLDYQMNDEEFFEVYFKDKMEVARAICYGNYNYMDAYVKFNAYGNLESCDEWERNKDFEDRKEEILDHYLELYSNNHVFPSADLEQKIRTYYEEDEEEEN